MSSTITSTTTTGQKHLQAVSKPSFFGMVRGELFKVSRMWIFWISLVLMLGALCLPYIVTAATPSRATGLKNTPLVFFYESMQLNLLVLRVFIGFFLIILTANVFGREYQLGTIRILLGRGIGRLQLLFAKLLTVVLIALLVFALGLLLNVLLQYMQMWVLAGNFDGLKGLNDEFWHNTWIYIGTILISMGVTILLTIALTAIGRSLSFGLSASLVFFPIDNIATIFMRLGYQLTKNDFWKNVTAYFLGPMLNYMPKAIVPKQFESFSAQPLVTVGGTQTLVVAGVYAAIFTVVALVLTWKRDVKE